MAPPSAAAPPRWDLLLLITGGLILISQARAHEFVPGLGAIRPGLLLALAGGVVWLSRKDPIGHLGRPLPLGVKLALFVLAWAAIGIPFSLWMGQAARGVVEVFGVAILVFLLVSAAPRHFMDIRRLLATMAVGAGIFAVMAPIRGRVPIRGFGAGGYDPNDSAMFLVSALPVLVLFAVSSKRLSGRILAGLGAAATLLAVVQTQSRGGFLALAAVLLFMLLFFRGIRAGAKILVVGVFCLGLAFTADSGYWERMESITQFSDGYGDDGDVVGGRLDIWKRGVGYMAANPMTGVGLLNFPVAEGGSPEIAEQIRRGMGAKFSAAHSMWVQVGAELGVPGVLAFMALFGHVMARLWRISRRRSRWQPDQEAAAMASALLGVLVGIIVAGSFLSNAYLTMVWVPLGIAVALIRLDGIEHRRRRHERRAGRSVPSIEYHAVRAAVPSGP